MKTTQEMAREANLPACHATHPKALERFAALVREDEREASAKVCEENANDHSEGDWDSACISCANSIRLRDKHD